MKRDKHSYFKDDMRRTLLLYAIVPVALLTVVCLFLFAGTWLYSLEKTNRNDNMRVTNDIEKTVTSYIEMTNQLAQQPDLLEEKVDTGTRVKIFEEIYRIANELDRKAYLYVFNKELVPVISSTKTIPEYLDGAAYANWGILRELNQNSGEPAMKIVKDEVTDTMQLVIGKAIMKTGEVEGYVVFTIDSKQFQKIIAEQHSQTVITDENGWVFLNNNYAFLNNLNRFDLKGQSANGSIENEYGKYYISSTTILDNNIRIYSLTPLDNQITTFLAIFIVLLLVFSMMIVAVFISSKTMAVKKTRDLYAIIEAFEKVKEGDLNTYVDISSNDELSVIGKSYNLMLDSLKDQKERNKEMGQLVAVSQSKQLESQFDPHFLFNTLENIRFMCKLEPESASKMIFNLATLLRYSISNTKEEVTLSDDVFYTKNYMSILKYRFKDHFQYSIDLPDPVLRCIIPKLIIQPMIENSIKYGFKGRKDLSVDISGHIEHGNLVLVCTDDGAGMNPEELKELKQIIAQNTNVSSHTGLFNIHRRVQLRYGEEYGIQIESEPGKGTCVRVVLPAKSENSGGL